MTNEIIKLLNQMDEEKDAIRDCKVMVENCASVQHSKDVHISATWIECSPYQDASRERINFSLKGEIKNLVLETISDYYTRKESEHSEKLKELLECLKNLEDTPSGAATPAQGNVTD